jgi:hypothetical protein
MGWLAEVGGPTISGSQVDSYAVAFDGVEGFCGVYLVAGSSDYQCQLDFMVEFCALRSEDGSLAWVEQGAGGLEEVEWFRWPLAPEFFDVVGKVAADTGYCAGFGDSGKLSSCPLAVRLL